VDPRRFEFFAVKWQGILSHALIETEIVALQRKEELEQEEASRQKAVRLRHAERIGDEWAKAEMDNEEAEATQARDLAGRKASFLPFVVRYLSTSCR